jgi:twitching motility protein PilT
MTQPADGKPTLIQLLKIMIERGASDMHITTGIAPLLRVDGNVVPLSQFAPLDRDDTQTLCYSVLNEAQRAQFEQHCELDLSFGIRGLSRFRANIFMQRSAVAGAFRTIPFKILTCEELGLPPVVVDFANKPSGLVLVTGPTGSGKSTTLAAIIDKINREQKLHIVTIEDPIEYLHLHQQSVVNQREVGKDTETFKNALKYVLRQDPDVVLIGEMRDLETVEAALTISETGHLVFATLHTNSAVSTINRIIDVFPPHQQGQIRSKLSFVLQGVVSQQLLPRYNAPGRVMALEVLVPNPAVRNLIREEKVHQVYSQMQVGQEKYGMQTLNQSLYSLVQRRLISPEEALGRAVEVEELKMMFEGRTAQAAPPPAPAPAARR